MKGNAIKDDFAKGEWRKGCHQTANGVTVMMHDIWKLKAYFEVVIWCMVFTGINPV
jgi:hypothetical protein